MINYNRNKDKYIRKKKRTDEALNLEKFMMSAGPVMEKVIEDNQAHFDLNNRAAAAKRNAVEMKQNLKFPLELLYLFSDADKQPATIDKISSLHMFEDCP